MSRYILQLSVFPAILITVGLFSLTALTAWAEDCQCITPSPCDDDSDASSWVFEPSYFSHDPSTGKRVVQYAPTPTVYLRQDPTYQESGFHYTQHLIRGPGGSLDAYHLVQTWGNGDRIRPYGEWKYPYRAGATPYGPWGNAQGPWTMPFDSWQNPYGLGRLRNPPWNVYPAPYSVPYGNPGYPPMPGPYDNGNENQGDWGDGYGDDGNE
jgi:hypothetical protein